MSEPPVPPPPPFPPTAGDPWAPGRWAPPAPPRRRHRVWAVVGVVAGLLLIGIVAAAVVPLLGHRGPGHPSRWDPRVADLAAFVEDERGLDFRHPVYVDFLTPAEYRKITRRDAKDLTAEDKRQLNEAAGLLRAVGLVEGDVDLFKAGNELSDTGTLAFYDNDTQRVRVRGTKLTPALRVTLAHELTHAVQDQHFDLKKHLADAKDSGESDAYRAVVEGDAERIEQRYVAQLSTADKASYEKESKAQSNPDQPIFKDVPDALVTFFEAPYALGSPFVSALDATEGNAGVDRALRVPPVSDEQLVDPLAFGSDDPVKVPTPKLRAGEKRTDDGDFGEMAWYLLLAARIDPHKALAAADGWGGDQYVQFRRDGKVCMRAAYRGDKAADTDQMAAALDEWQATTPAGNATVSRHGATVELDACDPGKDATLQITTKPSEALALPVTRSYIYAGSVAQAPNPQVAWCYADRLAASLTLAEVNDPEGNAYQDPSFVTRTRQAAASCR